MLRAMRTSVLNHNPLIYIYALCCMSRFSANAYNSILISRFSAVDGYHFRLLVEQMKPKDESQKSLIYVPTASYATSKLSTKSPGEQRRRARYDAKQKMGLLKEAFEIDKATILELDDPRLRSEQIERELTNAGILYVDGGELHLYFQQVLVF
jgi:peptidase E